MKEYVLVFDVESTSLHGEGFAVGAVVAHKKTGVIIENLELLSLEGEAKANDWVKENISPYLISLNVCETSKELRSRFYDFYTKWKDKCDVYSDVNFPVETNFLSAIVADDPIAREWSMPYPLMDVAAIVDVNMDREKESGEVDLVKHNPLHDAIASMRCLLKHLNAEKRMFQILDEMNAHDTEHGTRLVTLHPDIVGVNSDKQGVKVTMGVPTGVINPVDYITGVPKKRLVLMCVDGDEFDKRNAK